MTFHEETSSDPAGACSSHVLQNEGGLSSLYFEPLTEHLLASFRPTANTSNRIRHHVCTIETGSLAGVHNVSLSIKQTIQGGRSMRLLSRSKLCPVNASLYVMAGDEEAKGICAWDVSTEALKQKVPLPQSANAVDLCIIGNDQRKVIALDDSGKLSIYKLNTSD